MRPQARHTVAAALAPLFAAFAADCTVLGPTECGEPTRELIVVWLEGPLGVTAQQILGQVSLTQVEGRPMRGWWTVEAEPLRGHVKSVELREGETLVASLPLASAPISAGPISRGENFPATVRVPDEDAWSSLGAGRVALELRTDLPDRPLVRLAPPFSRNVTGYKRPRCNT